ncbi:uncharacterized protein LOC108332889 [Vigna angularis]|uniref:uncharacterized protein LOC108332889 n=1 Tax=Phaseolus angularis TaxID=3914 RepID=UPI0022B5D2C1|nr:uncharacterized protein LOC108332889 [Vigna angularis]
MAEFVRKTQSEKMDEMLHNMSLVISKMDDLNLRLSALENHPPSPPPSPLPFSSPVNHRHFLKLDVPRFDGSDPHEEERITVASFYLDGPALAWFQWMYRNGQIHSWPQLLQALEICFAPTAFDDPRGKLFKLTQTSSVAAYLSEFETLANRIVGLQPQFLLSCFISGLKPEIRREVLSQQPQTLSQASGLARLHEEKFQDLTRLIRQRSGPGPLSLLTRSPTTPLVPLVPLKQLPPLLPAPPPRTRFKQLTEAEMADRRERGLCFNCDQKFSRNHRCPARYMLLVAEEDNDSCKSSLHAPILEPNPPDPVSPVITDDPNQAQLCLNALSGFGAPETLRVSGQIDQFQVTVLVDGGSTHNFIQEVVANFLGLSRSPISVLKVMVGSGEVLPCTEVCTRVKLMIQGHNFQVDLYILGMTGSAIVLGAQWLKQLGPILMDYQNLTMQFNHPNGLIVLKGQTISPHEPISFHQLKRVLHSDPTAQFFSLSVTPQPDTSLPLPTLAHEHIPLQLLLHKYHFLFTEPSSLPPKRFSDHFIPLLPNSTPVNVRPYRYPQSQKI